MNWFLANGEERQAVDPEFEIPDKEERNSLQPGAFVKLMFLVQDEKVAGISMYVQVIEKVKEHYIGILDSCAYGIDGLNYGDRLVFKPENVLKILPED